MLKRWMNRGIIAIAIIILIGVTQAYAEKVVVDQKGSEAAALEQLLHTADSVIDDVDQWVIKWQAGGKGDARTEAAKLAVELGLGAPVYDHQTGHDVFRSEGTAGNSERALGLLLNVADTGNEGYYVIVQLSAGANLDRQTLLVMHGKIEAAMAESGMKASWNMSVQGKGKQSTADTSSESLTSTASAKKNAGEPFAQIEAKLSRELNMMEVERYEDTATTSVSYQAADLPLRIQSGSHMLNMQLAVHQVSGQDDARITVGFPIITIEY